MQKYLENRCVFEFMACTWFHRIQNAESDSNGTREKGTRVIEGKQRKNEKPTRIKATEYEAAKNYVDGKSFLASVIVLNSHLYLS